MADSFWFSRGLVPRDVVSAAAVYGGADLLRGPASGESCRERLTPRGSSWRAGMRRAVVPDADLLGGPFTAAGEAQLRIVA